MTARTALVLAWSLFAAVIAMLLGGLALIVFGAGDEDDVVVVAMVGFAFVGALVASRQPHNAVGWLLLAVALALVFTFLVDAYVRSPSAPVLEAGAWLSSWVWYVWLWAAAIFLPLLFPAGRLVSPLWRPVLWLGAVALALSTLGAALKPGPLDVDAATPIDNPLGVGGAASDVVAVMAELGNVLAAVAFVLAAASLVVRFRRSRGVERQQLKWFAYVGVLAIGGLALAMLQVLFGVQPGDPSVEEGGLLEVVGTVGWSTALASIVIGMPVATGIAILRHRLYDIDVVINRTLVYGALTATLALAYLASVLFLQLAVSPLTEQSDLAIAGSTLAVAALFRPARARIQGAVDRRFYRRKYDAAQTLERFSARLREELDLDALDAELRWVVAQTMQPAHVSLWLREARR